MTPHPPPPPPAICNIFRFLKKSIVFFPLYLSITAENKTKLKKLFIWTTNQEHNTTSKQTTPDYWSTTATMLVIFWTEQDFCTLSDCSNSTTNSKTYEQVKISLIQQIRSLHLKKPLRKNVKRLLVCVSFSLGSIYKY